MRRVIVFDVGGVIVRWQPLELMREHLPMVAADVAFEQVFQGWARGADWGEFDLGRIEADLLADRLAARTGYPVEALRSLLAAVPQHLQPMRESVALIERLRAAGHRLALLSNMPRPYADHLEATHECIGWFEQRAWSGRLGLMKPDRAIFEHVAQALAIDPPEALFIDDHLGNVEAARALGWSALLFTGAADCVAALEREGWL